MPTAPQPALVLCPHVRRLCEALPRLHINRRTRVKPGKSSYTRTSPNKITPQMDGVSAPQSCVPLHSLGLALGPGSSQSPPPARLSVLSAGPPNSLCLALKTGRVQAVLGSSQSAWGSVLPTRHCPHRHLSAPRGHWGGTSAQRAQAHSHARTHAHSTNRPSKHSVSCSTAVTRHTGHGDTCSAPALTCRAFLQEGDTT